jgi:hypothetical protein
MARKAVIHDAHDNAGGPWIRSRSQSGTSK